MYDIQLVKGDLSVTYTLPVNTLTVSVEKEPIHVGITDPGNNNSQTAILLDLGIATEIITIRGIANRVAQTYSYLNTNYTIPGLSELNTVFSDWWKDITDIYSGAGMPRLYDTTTTYWTGVFGDCKLSMDPKNTEDLEFQIAFYGVIRVA